MLFRSYDFIELPTPQTYTPARGIVSTPRVKMLKTSVPAYTATLAANGYGWEVQPDENSPYAVVTTILSPESTITWMLDGNDVELPIWRLPKVRAMFELMPDLKDRAKARHEIEALVRGEYTTDTRKTVSSIKDFIISATGANDQGPGINPPLPNIRGKIGDIVDGLIRTLVSGVEAFPESAYVLRKTMVLNPATNVSPGFQDANKVFTFNALIATEPGIPLNIGGILTELKGYWQKKTPQASQAADGTWTYTVEYVWAPEVDEFIYEVIT